MRTGVGFCDAIRALARFLGANTMQKQIDQRATQLVGVMTAPLGNREGVENAEEHPRAGLDIHHADDATRLTGAQDGPDTLDEFAVVPHRKIAPLCLA